MSPKRRAIILAALGLLLSTNYTRAAVTGIATLVRDPPGTPFTAPDAALGAPWMSLQLSLESTAGEIIGGWSVNIESQLHQRWHDNDFDDVLNSTPVFSASNTRADSHLIVQSGNLVTGALEDNDAATAYPGTSPLSPNNTYIPGNFTGGLAWGVGTFLTGEVDIVPANQGTTANMALIVIPEEELFPLHPFLSLNVSVENSEGIVIDELNECDFFFCDHPGGEAEIHVRGNNTIINDGDTTPSTSNHTDFGTVPAGSVQQRTYSIHNFGEATLYLYNLSLTGDSEFSLIGSFPASVSPGESADFTIALNTSTAGSFSAMLTIENDDGTYDNFDEAIFDFYISGTVEIPEPASVLLVGLATFGFISFVRPRRAG